EFEKYFDNILILYIYIIYSNVEDFIKEGRIMKIDPRIISRIYLNDLTRLTTRRICKRYYTTTIDQINSLCEEHKDLNFGHIKQVINIGQAILKKKQESLLKDTIMEISTNEAGIIKTKSLNSSFTEELNKNFKNIEENLDFFCEKGLIKEKNKEIFKIELNKGFGSKRMINKETIGFAAINNLTTSPKNAEKIIGPGEIEEYPLSKGLYMYKNKTLLFLLEDSE